MVQQLQEGLVDFMVSGTAIWGSVAPKLQVLDFPFLWRDWDHVHGVVDGPVGREAADYMEAAVGRPAARLGRLVRLPPGDHALARRERARPARGPQDPDDPVADLRQGRRADGREPDADGLRRGLHVAPDRRHRRLRARREHDAAAALLRGRALHGRARGHIAGVLGPVRLGGGPRPPPSRAPPQRWRRPPSRRRGASARWGPRRTAAATAKLAEQGMTIREIDRGALPPARRALWQAQARDARHRRGSWRPRVSAPADARAASRRARSTGRSRSSSARWPPSWACRSSAATCSTQPMAVDRGDRAAAARVADVHRRHPRARGRASTRA